jgi:hypothetical protein
MPEPKMVVLKICGPPGKVRILSSPTIVKGVVTVKVPVPEGIARFGVVNVN